MRTIVRCAILAPALAFGLPAGRAASTAETESSAPAAPRPNDPPIASVPVQPAKPIPPFLSRAKPESSTPTTASRVTDAEEAAKKSPANPEFTASIQRSFPYAPSPEPTAEETPTAADLPVVEMKPFHVATDRIVERVTKGLAERRQQELEKAFNVKDGGRFGKIGPAEIGLKFDLKHKGWDILSIPW